MARYTAQGKDYTKMKKKAKVRCTKEAKVRCTFDLFESEAQELCEMRCEPKPSTAAAQVVRMAIKKEAGK